MWHGAENMGWGWIGLGLLHMAVVWAVVILGLAVILHWRREPHAMDLLKERYANGELTREQFERMKREIAEQPRKA